MALSFLSLNNLGFGFPIWGNGVTVPISTKPKPKEPSSSNKVASLSKPAASPTGLGNFKPNKFLSNLESLMLNIFRTTQFLPS